MAAMTFEINKTNRERLTKIAKSTRKKPDTLINKALEDYLFQAEMDAHRRKFRKKAKELGIKSEEDIYRMIS